MVEFINDNSSTESLCHFACVELNVLASLLLEFSVHVLFVTLYELTLFRHCSIIADVSCPVIVHSKCGQSYFNLWPNLHRLACKASYNKVPDRSASVPGLCHKQGQILSS